MMRQRIALFFLVISLVSLLPVSVFAAETGYAPLIDPVAEECIGETVPGACVIISEKGGAVFSKGYGFADMERGIPMDPEATVFEWGSISKTFVWVSVMQLEEQGRLDLTKDIRAYLPKGFLKNLRFEEPITLLHLMNHTAGFEEQMLDLRFYEAAEEAPLLAVMSEHQPEQVFPPGEVCAYSNWGAALAALIVEQVSGRSYRDYAQENILEPLDMKSTSAGAFWDDVPGLLENKAAGYSCGRPGFRREPPMHLQMYPAGAMNGSASDLLKYAKELAKSPGQETVLFQHPETKERLFEETWRSYGANAGLCHGFWQYAGDGRTLGHEGGTYGFKTQLWVQPDQERAILILTNVMETDFCSRVMEELLYREANAPLSMEEADVSLFAGDYLPARSVWSNPGKIHGRMQMITIAEAGENDLKLALPFEDKELIYKPVGQHRFWCEEAAPEERMLAFSVEGGSVRIMSFRLAHDYVPAPFGQSLVFTALSVALFFVPLLVWLAMLAKGIWMPGRRRRVGVQFFVLPAAGALMGVSCVIGVLRWFSHYHIISAELNAVAAVCFVCVSAGIIGQLIGIIKKKKWSMAVFLAFLLQAAAVSQFGFLTIV